MNGFTQIKNIKLIYSPQPPTLGVVCSRVKSRKEVYSND